MKESRKANKLQDIINQTDRKSLMSSKLVEYIMKAEGADFPDNSIASSIALHSILLDVVGKVASSLYVYVFYICLSVYVLYL